MFLNFKMNEGDVCLVDCATTHTIFREKIYFFNLITTNTNVSTISGTSNLIEGSGRANIVLPNGTRFHINDALYSSKSRRNLLSFKDIRRNGYHIETMNEGNKECLYITSIISGKNIVAEKLLAFSSGLYHTTIKSIESNVVVNQKFNDPKIFNLWHDRLGHPGEIFGCAVYVPIAPTQRTKMGPQRRIGIYVGFDSSSIIKYLEPMTGNVFRARFADCHFNETVFPQLGGEKSIPEGRHEITWNASTLSHLDQRTNQCELEVQMIIHLQNLANQLPDTFVNTKKVAKSHILAANVPARVDITEGQKAFEFKTRSKRGRPIGSKDITPRKRRTNGKQNDHEESNIENQIPEEIQNEQIAPEEVQVPENNEISISYVHMGKKWDRNNFDVNNIFTFQVALDIIQNDDDPEPQNTNECRQRNDWPKWKAK